MGVPWGIFYSSKRSNISPMPCLASLNGLYLRSMKDDGIAKRKERVYTMKKPSQRTIAMLTYIRDNPGCRPGDIVSGSKVYASSEAQIDGDAVSARQCHVDCLSVGSMCGLCVRAGLLRREDKPRRFWLSDKGVAYVQGFSDPTKPTNQAFWRDHGKKPLLRE